MRPRLSARSALAAVAVTFVATAPLWADLLPAEVTDVAPVPSRDLVDYVATGRSSATLRRLDPELRAALDLGRARVLAARGVESPGLRDAIVRADPLHGPVRIALETWPAPQPGPHERMAVLE